MTTKVGYTNRIEVKVMGLGKVMQEYVLLEQREDSAGHLECL